uniref:Uncharacterized protein n=1 Tax=Anopheles dirus TaxID=7168 RepID=A0A9I3EI53_9DIPT
MRRICIILLVCLAVDAITCARTKTRVVADACSTAYSEKIHGTREAYNLRIRDPNQHISTRLVRYFRLGGILQAIAEKAGIERTKIVADGSSQFQDQSSGRGHTHHAAHLNRVGAIHSGLKDENLKRALQNYIGHTQIVLSEFNVWHGVGGDIDRYQSENLVKLAGIDFNGAMEPSNRRTIEDLITSFRAIIDKYVQNGSGDAKVKKVLEEDKLTVYCVGPLMLFEEGKEGYDSVKNGEFVKNYDPRKQKRPA